MEHFCASCDAMVEPEDAAVPRCPRCQRRVDSVDSASVGPASGRSSVARLAASAALVVAAAGAAWWWTAPPAELPVASPAIQAGDQAVATRFAAAGMDEARSIWPGATDAALEAAARAFPDTAAVVAHLSALVADGRLRPASARERRDHPMRPAVVLWAELQAGRAAPVHGLEVAWLARALFTARGAPVAFVASSPMRTPLILAHSRVAVRLEDGTILDPLGQGMETPATVADSMAVAWWLILRAHHSRAGAKHKEAHAELDLAATFAADLPGILFARGVSELDQGMIDKGIATCEAALAQQDDAFARLFLADVYATNQRPFKAWEQVEQVLKTHPELPEAWVSKGMLDGSRAQTLPDDQKGPQLEKAAAALTKAIELDPTIPGARVGLAQLALARSDQPEAERILNEAIEKYTDLQAAVVLSALWAHDEKSIDAAEMLTKLGRLDDEQVVEALVSAWHTAGKEEKALEVIEQAAALAPTNVTLAILKANVLRAHGRVKDATAALQPLLAGSQNDDLRLTLGSLYLSDKQPRKAIELLESVRSHRKDDKQIAAMTLSAWLSAEDMTGFRTLAAELLELGVLRRGDIAGMLAQQGRADEAVELLEQAAALPDVEPSEAGLLALIWTAAGRKEDAIALRDRLVAGGGKHAEHMKLTIDGAIAAAEQELQETERAEQDQPAPPQPGGPAR